MTRAWPQDASGEAPSVASQECSDATDNSPAPVLQGWGSIVEPDCKRLAAAYLEARGGTLDAFLTVGGEVVPDASRIDPIYPREPALLWRFFDPAGRPYGYEAGGVHHLYHRVRTLGRQNTFLQPRASGTHVYFVRHPSLPWPEVLADPSHGLILSEGESRALAGIGCDLPVISLTGVDCWHLKGEKDLHPDLASIEWKGRTVYLAFDSDASYKENVQHALSQLGGALSQRGADVWQIHIPAAPDGSKQGLDDYLSRWGVDAFHELRQSAETVPLVSNGVDVFSTADNASEEHTVAELLSREVSPVEELIPGLIEKGIPNFIAAPGGTHKSRLALQLGLCLNAAAPVWGLNAGLLGLRLPKVSLVFCSAEDDADELARRATAISATLKLPAPKQGQFLVRRGMDSALVVMGENGKVEVRPFFHELLGRLRAIPGHKIVVLDSAYDFVRFAGRAKIDEDSVNFFIKVVLQHICDNGDCTLVIPWHPSQAGSERATMDGWSVAWQNAPRARLAIKAVKDVPDTYELSVAKRNHGPRGQAITLRFHEGAMLPPEALPDDGKEAALHRCVVAEAVVGARAGVPFTSQRNIAEPILRKIAAASGTEVSSRLVRGILDTAARDGELTYMKGTSTTAAGYYPPGEVDSLAKRNVRRKGVGGNLLT